MKQLPMKSRILQWAIQKNGPFKLDDVMSELSGEFGGESQFNKKRVEDYLQTFVGVKMLKADKMSVTGNGELNIDYVITPFGKTKEKYFKGY